MSSTGEQMFIAVPEEVVSRLMALRKRPNEPLAEVIARHVPPPLASSGEHAATRARVPTTPEPRIGRYKVMILGETFVVASLAEVLAATLNALADLEPQILPMLASIGGRTRRHVARQPDAIHPGRPDLNRNFTREFRPGWWIGTNYSSGDVRRILRDASRAVGLRYGHDIVFEK